MEVYKPNSNRSKQEQMEPAAKMEKVVSGSVRPRKKSKLGKFSDVFRAKDVENVKSFIFTDVLIPIVKKAISDFVASSTRGLGDGLSNCVDVYLFGEAGARRKGRTDYTRASYRTYYDDKRRDDRKEPYVSAKPRMAYDYDDLTFDNRGDAELVLSILEEHIAEYKIASVADLYDLAGVSCSHTSNKFGWTDISGARVVQTRDGGWVLDMPRAIPID